MGTLIHGRIVTVGRQKTYVFMSFRGMKLMPHVRRGMEAWEKSRIPCQLDIDFGLHLILIL
jgi:hypothetical protein